MCDRVESGIRQDFLEGGEAFHVPRVERVELLLCLRDLRPGLSRPIIDQLLLCRESSDRSSAVNDSGTHNLHLGIDEREVGREDADDRVAARC